VNAMTVITAPAAEVPFGKLLARIWTLVGFLCVLLAACNGIAQATPEGADGIDKLTRPLVLDGKMGDPGWKSATMYADFQMRHPEAGKAPSERTEVYLAHDATTLGVAGLIQSGGFGSFSKHYGLAAAGLLEAEVVTADGKIRIANACTNPDLFWALKGGGGGSFGAVSKVTLRLRGLPRFFGRAIFTIRAASDDAYRRLLRQFVSFYREQLFNDHWGEQAHIKPNNSLVIRMVFYGLDAEQATKVGKVSDQAYGDFVFHPFAIRLSSSTEEQYPGFALSTLFLFQPPALMSLRHCRLSLVKRMLYGLSNILKHETRQG